jgi:hypoxanthine phosphoribosyltransferase
MDIAKGQDKTLLSSWPGEIGSVLFTEEQIQGRVTQLGVQISQDYAGKDLVVIGVLKGVIFFMADLLRALTIPVTVDFMAISRFGPTQQTRGVVNLTKDLNDPLTGRHVLFVEDIIDTGFTTHYITRNLMLREPASLEICTLLNRPHRRIIEVKLSYVGFEIPDYYVVGYGLDYKEQYRNLPYIVKLEANKVK